MRLRSKESHSSKSPFYNTPTSTPNPTSDSTKTPNYSDCKGDYDKVIRYQFSQTVHCLLGKGLSQTTMKKEGNQNRWWLPRSSVMVRRRSFPFQKRSPSFLRHWKKFWPVIESVSMKKKGNRNTASSPDLETGRLSYSYLSTDYNTDSPKFQTNIN